MSILTCTAILSGIYAAFKMRHNRILSPAVALSRSFWHYFYHPPPFAYNQVVAFVLCRQFQQLVQSSLDVCTCIHISLAKQKPAFVKGFFYNNNFQFFNP
jgi:hypothetical protein